MTPTMLGKNCHFHADNSIFLRAGPVGIGSMKWSSYLRAAPPRPEGKGTEGKKTTTCCGDAKRTTDALPIATDALVPSLGFLFVALKARTQPVVNRAVCYIRRTLDPVQFGPATQSCHPKAT